jgi:hypothetical protein
MAEEKPRHENYIARGRERLRALAEACGLVPANRELDRLRAYLLEWSQHQRSFGAKPKGANASTLADFVQSGWRGVEEHLDTNGWVMEVMDSSIDDLLTLPDGGSMRAALRVRYLNEGISPTGELSIRVFRNKRLEGMSMAEADRLADAAELALIPLVKQRGIQL